MRQSPDGHRTDEYKITVASVSDRGLSEKRPLNEDSFFTDEERGIFVVADGVGGAEAGEVASRTTVDVLAEAFRHHKDGDDVEDLMELAIQRANSSIYQMSREHPKLAMMATTVVALHLDGGHATLGHVGDSRIYRVTPEGVLQRETDDHSVVEEEVRAGRMTAQQAANHPSRNVISRAIGAEASVEVDLKTIEIAQGTIFLLCSDGITRHIPDEELEQILQNSEDLPAACAQMKEICYERGAEDNLTAVIVQTGVSPHATARINVQNTVAFNPHFADTLGGSKGSAPTARIDLSTMRMSADELAREREAIIKGDGHVGETAPLSVSAATMPLSHAPQTNGDTSASQPFSAERQSPEVDTRAGDQTAEIIHPQSSGVQNLHDGQTNQSNIQSLKETPVPQSAPRRSAVGTILKLLTVLFLVSVAGVAAFYGGMNYERFNHPVGADASSANAVPTAATATPVDTPEAKYERRRREIDSSPARMFTELRAQANGQPWTSTDPEYLYLYGRAALLSGDATEASSAFKRANELLQTTGRDPLRVETRLTALAAAARAGDRAATDSALRSFDEVVERRAGDAGVGQPPPADGASVTQPTQMPAPPSPR